MDPDALDLLNKVNGDDASILYEKKRPNEGLLKEFGWSFLPFVITLNQFF